MKYYIDTCIFLNVWKGEVGPNKKWPFYRTSDEFLKKYKKDILISTKVLTEIERKLSEGEFKIRCLQLLDELETLDVPEDVIAQAQRIYQDIDKEISFADIIHMLMTEREGATLITRDRALMTIARAYDISVASPDDLVRY
jgi:predicted nucleic acid-binding protein